MHRRFLLQGRGNIPHDRDRAVRYVVIKADTSNDWCFNCASSCYPRSFRTDRLLYSPATHTGAAQPTLSSNTATLVQSHYPAKILASQNERGRVRLAANPTEADRETLTPGAEDAIKESLFNNVFQHDPPSVDCESPMAVETT